MSQVLDLYRLQKIDSQKDQAIARIRAIEQILQQDESLRTARSQKDATDLSLRESQTSLHHSEDLVRNQRIKIEHSEAALYGGSVRNPKELQELQNEVASLKRYLNILEERQLEAMLDVDEKSSSQQLAETRLQLIENEFSSQHTALIKEQDQLTQELHRLESERSVACSSIPPDWAKKYERLRNERRGIAVATVDVDSCSACGAELPPAERQAARSHANLTTCSSCGRILYAG